MFKIGDIVRIKECPDAMEGSPADNLAGSVVEITEVRPREYGSPLYSFRYVEKHAKNNAKCFDSDSRLAWEDEHLIENIDISSLLEV